MAHKFSEEVFKYLKLEAYRVEEVAEKGEYAEFYRGEYEDLPSPDIIGAKMKEKGYDTFEVTYVIETVKRYSVDEPQIDVEESEQKHELHKQEAVLDSGAIKEMLKNLSQ